MDLTTITVSQFEAQFPRDFPYLDNIIYDPDVIYNTGDEIYYPPTKLFYQSLIDGNIGIVPGSFTKWDQGSQDYDVSGQVYDAAAAGKSWCKYADSIDNWIQDADITRAFAEALIVCNQGLFGTDAQVTLGYLYLTAHYLCNDIKASLAGVNSTGGFPVSSRSVGSVSESYSIPEAYTQNPILAMYTQSSYGMKYLALALPNMVGNMQAVWGGSLP